MEYVSGTIWINYETKNYQIQKFKCLWFSLTSKKKKIDSIYAV